VRGIRGEREGAGSWGKMTQTMYTLVNKQIEILKKDI
jgi:hypothetical protein